MASKFQTLTLALLCLLLPHPPSTALEILSKSRLERCSKSDDSGGLNCENKIVIDVAVPSGSSGGEASIVAQLVEVEEHVNDTQKTIREPPVITINKSAAYASYKLTYIRDVAYKPEEFHVETRKCEPYAGHDILQDCDGTRDQNGNIIEGTQPVCCPCGPQRRVPSSCGNIFKKMFEGKPNTAHCLRFQGDWFHVFSIGQRSIGFSIRIEVRKGSSLSEVIVGPENRTVLSNDNFLRVNLVGDFVGYTSIPSFEDVYLVTPRLGDAGQPADIGRDYSKWLLIDKARFSFEGECNKIGVTYEAYRNQPNFCGSPLLTCLHSQIWHYWESDQNLISRNQTPIYVVEGRFERINQHPDAGTHSFSIGITEVLNSNLLLELRADDIEFVYQRSPGKILGITIPTFEALTQFGTAKVITKNIGTLEASYSLTFHCLTGIGFMEEQFYIMKPEEVVTRQFYLYPTTDQAAKYECTAIIKASDFSEVDRAQCQFTTTATILDNGTQIIPSNESKEKGIDGFLKSIKSVWRSMWEAVVDFFSGRTCRTKCSSFFDFSCHMQYICVSWILMFSLLLAIFPTVLVLLWLLHQKGFFDPLYDWWDDKREGGIQKKSKHGKDIKHHGERDRHLKRRGSHVHHVPHKHSPHELSIQDHYHHRYDGHLHVHKESHKHKHNKSLVHGHAIPTNQVEMYTMG